MRLHPDFAGLDPVPGEMHITDRYELLSLANLNGLLANARVPGYATTIAGAALIGVFRGLRKNRVDDLQRDQVANHDSLEAGSR